MNSLQPEIGWPESWRLSYSYDEMEVWGNKHNLSYFYAYQNRKNKLIKAIEKVLLPGSSIIDLAAGSGNFTLWLAEKGYQMIWNDLRADLIPYVKAKHERGDVSFVPGNIFNLEIQPVDGVIVSEIIEHVAHPDDFLFKVSDLVKPGGYVFLSTPLGNYFLNRLPRFTHFAHPEIFEERQFMPNADGHIFLLHLDEISTLAAKAGLTLCQIHFNNNPLSSGHIKLRHLQRLLPSGWVAGIEQFTGKLPVSIARKLHSNIVVVLKRQAK